MVGWVHAHRPRQLLADSEAEVLGIVVDRDRRGEGVGRPLMAEAERWAVKKGCGEALLRSSVIREETYRAEVIATVGSEGHAGAALEAGTHHVLNYRADDVAARVAEITGGSGVGRVVEVAFGRNLALDAEARTTRWRR